MIIGYGHEIAQRISQIRVVGSFAGWLGNTSCAYGPQAQGVLPSQSEKQKSLSRFLDAQLGLIGIATCGIVLFVAHEVETVAEFRGQTEHEDSDSVARIACLG